MIFNLDIVMKNTTASLDSNYPEDAAVIAGEDVTFKAVIVDEGHPKGYTLQWYVDGKAVEDATGETYTRSTSSDKGVLSVWCEASNKAGTATSRHATLTVKKAPALDASYPQNVSTTIGKSVTFETKITESGHPDSYTYQWYVNGNAVSGATSSSYTRTGTAIGSESIHCVVSNDAGSVQSRTATFSVAQEYIVKNGAFTDGGTWGGYLSGGAGRVTQESGYLYIHCDGWRTARAWSNNYYDFTGKNKLVFYCDFGNTCSGGTDIATFHFGACDSLNDDNFIALTAARGRNANGVWISVDISRVTGWHHIKIAITRAINCADIVAVKDVYFE